MPKVEELLTKDILQARFDSVANLLESVGEDEWLISQLEPLFNSAMSKLDTFDAKQEQLQKFISLLNNHKVQRIDFLYIEDSWWYIDDKAVYQELQSDDAEYGYLFDARYTLNYDYYVEEVDIDIPAIRHWHSILPFTEYRLRKLSAEAV